MESDHRGRIVDRPPCKCGNSECDLYRLAPGHGNLSMIHEIGHWENRVYIANYDKPGHSDIEKLQKEFSYAYYKLLDKYRDDIKGMSSDIFHLGITPGQALWVRMGANNPMETPLPYKETHSEDVKAEQGRSTNQEMALEAEIHNILGGDHDHLLMPDWRDRLKAIMARFVHQQREIVRLEDENSLLRSSLKDLREKQRE